MLHWMKPGMKRVTTKGTGIPSGDSRCKLFDCEELATPPTGREVCSVATLVVPKIKTTDFWFSISRSI